MTSGFWLYTEDGEFVNVPFPQECRKSKARIFSMFPPQEITDQSAEGDLAALLESPVLPSSATFQYWGLLSSAFARLISSYSALRLRLLMIFRSTFFAPFKWRGL